jgi:hypothetical protein
MEMQTEFDVNGSDILF